MTERKRMGKKGALVLGAGIITLSGSIYHAAQAQGAPNDPYAVNNGNYPTRAEYTGPFTVANHDYPTADSATREGFVADQAISLTYAPIYLGLLKAYLAPTIGELVNAQSHWDPAENGWYDMVWIGQGDRLADGSIDPSSGREPIMNTYTGQIEPAAVYATNRFDPGHVGPVPSGPVQNHASIYYNETAAVMLGEVWANPYAPNIDAIDFPDGSVALKIEAVTTPPEEWAVTTNASVWQVYRPPIPAGYDPTNPPASGAAQVINAYPIQISIAVKDKGASPTTGWVFAALVYDANAAGDTPWDRFVPLGAMWGNDPQLATTPGGNNGDPANLTETWFNTNAPLYVHGTRGWGGRLAGPNDVAGRQNVLFMGGNNTAIDPMDVGASSCMSCHLAAEYPWTENIYPAPNRSFPPDGAPFVLYDQGSPEWNRWFQNYPGKYGVSYKNFPRGLDYDYAIMFALGAQAAAVGNEAYSFDDFDAH
ncbi:hypothetical protein [Sphingomicrobium aestuariivivum]|uniref:hypothetical protein n=1 Tax=Sphingomicrobium aestuariivivum TaxID=1582356 RepID=UPI001FD6B5CE|nr:hypothetical protein [Sphingomicrobium aestuariivivum]MCJ8192045.1 hypothetical protein [Sphingomicrobium aestuariivivum]